MVSAICTIMALLSFSFAKTGLTAMAMQSNRRAVLQNGCSLAAMVQGSCVLSSAPATAGDLKIRGLPGSLSPMFSSEMEGTWSPSMIQTELGKSRILARELSPLKQRPFTDQELYYPSFLFGSWQVKATLKRKVYPYGKSFAPSRSFIEGSPCNHQDQVGSVTSYECHYYSTLPNTLENQLMVQLGLGVPHPKVIADRAFNAISRSKTNQQLTPIRTVEWDPRTDPTRLSLAFPSDMQPLEPRRGEVYITARQSEFFSELVYACSEQSRCVLLGQGNVLVSDSESITEFHQIDPNRVTAVNRICVYLSPNPNSREGSLWQQTGGKAVAFYDYEIELNRILESFLDQGRPDIVLQRACVVTPKDIVQCE